MKDLIDQPTWAPTRKVTWTALGGAPSGLLIAWLLGQMGIEVPPEIASVIGTAAGTLFGWLMREHAQ